MNSLHPTDQVNFVVLLQQQFKDIVSIFKIAACTTQTQTYNKMSHQFAVKISTYYTIRTVYKVDNAEQAPHKDF